MSPAEFAAAARGPYGKLFAYLKPYRSRFIIGLLCGAVYGALNGLLVFTVHHVAGKVLPPEEKPAPNHTLLTETWHEDREIPELRAALTAREMAPADQAEALASYTAFRKALHERTLAAAPADPAADPLRKLSLSPDLPAEFRLVLEAERHLVVVPPQKSQAKKSLQELLALPEAERRYRTTWAQFLEAQLESDRIKKSGMYDELRATTTNPAFSDSLSLGAAAPSVVPLKTVIDGGETPDLIMFPQNYEGRDVMSRLSVKIDKTVITNNIDISDSGDGVTVVTPIFGGNTLVETTFTGAGPYLAAFRPKSFVAESAGGAAAAVTAVSVPDLGAAGAAQVTAVHVEETTGPKLDEADIVVSGGRGLGEAASYAMVEDLAKLLKGAPGASRAIVDAGWVPYSYQVGQTGKVVKPTIYLAAGISGATQHMVGMKGSKNIIAINKDKEAPIFGVADLGIVGDVHKVLPKLIEALKARG